MVELKLKKQKVELTGRIVKLDSERGFGFLRSEVNSVEYYFKVPMAGFN